MINKESEDLIKSFESLELKAYPDPATHAEPYTIGWGTTIYPNGKKVKLGDVCTQEEAQDYFNHDVQKVSDNVSSLIKRTLTDNQFGALISFTYNLGVGNLKSSTLLKKVNINPKDLSIAGEFLKWNKAAGEIMNGLTRRRRAESILYFK